ncbi:MAG: VWA domain-containing protein, partial [Halomonas sp.]
MAWWGKCRARRGGIARLLLVLLSLVATTGLAQPVEERPEVRVIIDVSGSMRDNDPDQLAASALELLASLLPAGTTAGVWTFGARVDNPLPPREVDAAWREQAAALRPQLVDYQQHTDIEGAVRAASEAPANGWRHLVLLTDGMIDLPPDRGAKPATDEASRRTLLEALAPHLADQGVVVHAIAFSGDADLALVERLAQSTGGLPALAETPESLLVAFLDIVERIFPADQVPLEEGRFAIEPGVEAFSALLFHDPDGEPLTLVAPDGARYRVDTPPPGGRWQVEPRFDLIRVPDPAPGEWRLEGEIAADSRIGVTSALTLRTGELPTTLYLGFPVPVEAWLERAGEPYSGDLESLALHVELRDPQDAVLAALRLTRRGERFVGELPAPALVGTARLFIRAEVDGLTRQRWQAVNVLPAITARHDPAASRVVLEAEHPALDHDTTELVGELAGERLVAEAVGERRWHLALPPLDDSISQPLLLAARVVLDGEAREIRLPRLVLFPEAQIGLGLAGGADGSSRAERFHEDLAAGRRSREPADSVADRFVAFLHELPGQARELWLAGWPGMQRFVETHGRDPRLWAAALGGGILIVILLAVRHARRVRRVVHREDP